MTGLELGERPEWHRSAACRDVSPNVMFPVDGVGVERAQRICAQCPVREECADAGLLEAFGIWGGTNERARRRLRKLAGIRRTRADDITDPDPDQHDDDLDQEDTA